LRGFVASERRNQGVTDDLPGSSGFFNFHPAIANAEFDCDALHATVRSIVARFIDDYTFADDTGKPSQ
jgi:hypothetical protein